MSKLRKTLLGVGIAVVTFCVVALVSFAILWHLQGLDRLTSDDTAAAMGAFAVFIRAVVAGVLAAAFSTLVVAFRLRRKTVTP